MRIFELLLSIMAIIFALALYLPKFPTRWKKRILPLTLALLAWLNFPLFSASRPTAPGSFRLPMCWGSSR